MKGLVPLFA